MPVDHPYIVTASTSGRLLPLSVKDEAWLQELLVNHPDVLPVINIDEEFAPLVPIGRGIANIDNLFISPRGLITLVQTKLWNNAEAHRTVVAQIMDYARELSHWSYDKLDDAVFHYTKKRGAACSIYQLVSQRVPNFDLDEIEFQASVQHCLETGRFALLIVGDKVFPQATQFAEIVQSAPHMLFGLGFVELKCYTLPHIGDDGIIIVPDLVSKTQEITRAVVRVVYEAKRPRVFVEPLDQAPQTSGEANEDVFLASIPTEFNEIFARYLGEWSREGYTISWSSQGMRVRISWQGNVCTMFEAYAKELSILKARYATEFSLPEDDYQRYKEALLASPLFGSAYANGRRFVSYDEMTVHDVEYVLECTNTLLHSVHRTQHEADLLNYLV